ncbi:SET domain-containing protein [Dichomitus squalens]|nr:SET domain-containing protein [Dichomitus squalens]
MSRPMEELERQRWERMLSWLQDKHGMDTSEHGFHVEARAVEGAGRGLFALRDCLRGTTLFKVPSTALMNRTTVAKLYPRLRERRLSGIHLVTLHLLLHRPPGDDDSSDPVFGPYISTLPRDFSSHPLHWMVKQELKQEDVWERRTFVHLPPSAAEKLYALQKRFWNDWKIVSSVLAEDQAKLPQSSRTDIVSTSLDIVKDATLTLGYLWAWLNGRYFVMFSSSRHLMYNPLVNTRCIFYRIRANRADPDNFTLCPVLDFANHYHGQTHIFPVIDSEPWSAETKKLPKYFTFFSPSQEGLTKGQELYLRYGSHSNSLLFAEYGFVNVVPGGAIKSGEYPGEVDVEELVEYQFTEKGSLGARMKSALEDEGYWGDWTLHSAPTPAHPSYRLMVALRLLHALESNNARDHEQDTAFESVLEIWRNVISGYADYISPQNEEQWRRTLLHICERITDRAHTRLETLSTLELNTRTEERSWRRWMTGNVVALWTEERDVAEAVKASILSGVEF